MIIFGGYTAIFSPEYGTYIAEYLNDVWILSLDGTPTWNEIIPAGAPPSPRSEHFAAFDSIHQRMLIVGGFGTGNPTADIWVLSLAGTPAWSQIIPTGSPPPAGTLSAAVYDETNQRVIVLLPEPGSTTGIPTAYQLSLAGELAWSRLPRIGVPPPRSKPGRAVYDPQRERMVLFGSDRTLNGVWSLSLPSAEADTPAPTSTVTPTASATPEGAATPLPERTATPSATVPPADTPGGTPSPSTPTATPTPPGSGGGPSTPTGTALPGARFVTGLPVILSSAGPGG